MDEALLSFFFFFFLIMSFFFLILALHPFMPTPHIAPLAKRKSQIEKRQNQISRASLHVLHAFSLMTEARHKREEGSKRGRGLVCWMSMLVGPAYVVCVLYRKQVQGGLAAGCRHTNVAVVAAVVVVFVAVAACFSRSQSITRRGRKDRRIICTCGCMSVLS